MRATVRDRYGPPEVVPVGPDLRGGDAGREGPHYARSSIRAAKVRRGQDVLVCSATGALGSAAVQLLKQVGATSRCLLAVRLACHIEGSITVPSGQPGSLPSGY